MTTADWVFEKAIHLMDEQNETTGAVVTADTKEYRNRTLSILNILRHELYPYSDTYEAGVDGVRSICPLITSFTDEIGLDDAIAQGVLPYGLAAHLLLGENDTMASFFIERYQELVRSIGLKKPAQWEDIIPAYGGLTV
nr:MAG TPA: hypothetical protein [Caudoviricetes sp.]